MADDRIVMVMITIIDTVVVTLPSPGSPRRGGSSSQLPHLHHSPAPRAPLDIQRN